mmetsp:Transcript_7932/g.11981  ORF Transcript_7932/g.11981 Transcript_7932/m.11981 type:complete len:503 (+) Transcript_7932:204-1712(+)
MGNSSSDNVAPFADEQPTSNVITEQHTTSEKNLIEQLEQEADNAHAACIHWTQTHRRLHIPYPEEDFLKMKGKVVKAEDKLAHARFANIVNEEWERIEAVVDEELERIEGLGRQTKGFEVCAVCNKDLSNKLALVKKYGAGKVKYGITHCCGKIICYQCSPPSSRDFTTVLKQMTEKAEKEGGPSVLDVQLPGPQICPNCNHVVKGNLTERQKFKWNEKFAAEGIPWGMFEVSVMLKAGKGCQKNLKKAKKWMEKAAETNYDKAMHALAIEYSLEGTPQSLLKAKDLLLGAADQGHDFSYHFLSVLYLGRGEGKNFPEKNLEKAKRFASLAAYYQNEALMGNDCEQMMLCHSKSDGSFVAPRDALPDSPEALQFQLMTYWAGKGAHLNDSLRVGFSNMLALFTSEKFIHKYSGGCCFPGYTTLPLAKKMLRKGEETSILITAMSKKCIHCNKKNVDGSMKQCSGCKVFYFCGQECQLKHWNAGHKRECKGEHWIKEFMGLRI